MRSWPSMNLTIYGTAWRTGRVFFPYLLSALLPALPAQCQDSVNELGAISGNSAVIVVTVRDSSGGPLSVPAMVKLYRSGGIPNGQGTTGQGGRAIFTPQNLGDFTVIVEAPGYKTGHGEVSVPIPVKAEVDIYMQPEKDSATNATGTGSPLLAPKAKESLDKGLQALRDDKLEEAEKHLKEAMRLAPGHPDVLYLRGVLYMRRNNWAQAQGVFEKATQIDPNHARAFAALGTALCNQGKYDVAIAPLEKSLQLSAGGWETHWTLAKAYYYQKQYDEALKTSQQALQESNGKAPEIELLVAQALTAVGRYADSAKALRQFLKNHPDHPEAATARRWLERLTVTGKIKNE
jgi:Flp pilus assembly protein TadD